MGKQAELTNALLRHMHFIQRLGGGQARQMQANLDQFVKRIETKLFKKDLTLLSRKRLTAQLKQFSLALKALRVAETKDFKKHITDLVRYETDFMQKLTNDSIQFDEKFVVPSVMQIEEQILQQNTPYTIGKRKASFDGFMTKFFAGYEKESIQAIRDGILLGESNNKIARNIRRITGSKKREAEALARTFTNYTSNLTRDRFYEANKDIVKQVRWLSTLDSTTCPECGVLDQQEFDLGKAPAQPHHFNCRCTKQPVLANDLNAASGVKVNRAGVDEDGNIKQYDGRTSYQSFFEQQSEAFKREHLGATRYAIYKKNKVSPKEFVDGKFNLINLDKLRGLDDKFNLKKD